MQTPLPHDGAHPRLSGGPLPEHAAAVNARPITDDEFVDAVKRHALTAEQQRWLGEKGMAAAFFDDYQSYTQRHAIYPPDIGLIYTTLGLAGEAGEVANKVKKAVRDDGGTVTPERREALKQELGDVLWYLAAVAREAGLPLSEIAAANLSKLDARKDAGTIRGSGDNR